MTRPTRHARTALLLVAMVIVVGVGLRLGRGPIAAAPMVGRSASGASATPSSPSPSLPETATFAAAPETAVAAADPPGTDYAPRPADEWQGMRVDRATQARCGGADSCGLAMACLDGGRCGPCQADSQCAAGEACVLDHCVLAPRAACRSRTDCGSDELCVLTGYSADPRGNAAMAARCLPSSGGSDRSDEIDRPASEPAGPMPVPAQDLLEQVEADVATPAR